MFLNNRRKEVFGEKSSSKKDISNLPSFEEIHRLSDEDINELKSSVEDPPNIVNTITTDYISPNIISDSRSQKPSFTTPKACDWPVMPFGVKDFEFWQMRLHLLSERKHGWNKFGPVTKKQGNALQYILMTFNHVNALQDQEIQYQKALQERDNYIEWLERNAHKQQTRQEQNNTEELSERIGALQIGSKPTQHRREMQDKLLEKWKFITFDTFSEFCEQFVANEFIDAKKIENQDHAVVLLERLLKINDMDACIYGPFSTKDHTGVFCISWKEENDYVMEKLLQHLDNLMFLKRRTHWVLQSWKKKEEDQTVAKHVLDIKNTHNRLLYVWYM